MDAQRTESALTGFSIAPVSRNYARGQCVPFHSHTWPQLLYASAGVVGVETSTGSWIVPPQRGLWLPPNTEHETRMLTDVALSSLYLPDATEWNRDCRVIEISALLRELIVAAVHFVSDPVARREQLLIDLMIEELRDAPLGSSPIPMPESPRLVALCRRVINNPTGEISLDQHASDAGLTPKTVGRMFQRELGLSFRDWRQMAQISYSIAHLTQGSPVKVVACALGYTPSAFSAMFLRATGLNPGNLARSGPGNGVGVVAS